MAFPLIPLAIGAIGAIGSLIKRRRQSQALAGASFSATAQSTPTTGISDAASNPNSAQTPAGRANSGGVTVGAARVGGPQVSDQSRGAGLGTKTVSQDAQSAVQPATGPQQTQGDPGLAARLGAESVAKSRAVNIAQKKKQALSQNSLGGGV